MAPSSTAQEILALKKSLNAAASASRTEQVKSILKQLKNEIIITEDLIRDTKIGISVSKLRQHGDSGVADLAKELVKKWKSAVQSGDKSKKELDSNVASPSPSGGESPATIPIKGPKLGSKPAGKPSHEGTPVKKGSVRTHKIDGLDFSKDERSKGDKTRDKCAEMVYDALSFDSDAPVDLILRRARDLEEHVYTQIGETSNQYRTKMRSLFLNLKAANNPSLRADVVSGDISVSRLYEMKPEDLASEEQRAMNRKIAEENLFKAQAAAPTQAVTDAFQCGKCKQRKTMYYQMQTRSADEPMTTFVTCLNCNNRWKFS